MFKSLLLKGRMLCVLLACLISSLAVTAQTRITGKVIGSDDKLPVVGASVRLRGTNTGTVTDVNGGFSLNANTNDVLVISFIGYATKSVTVTGPNLGTITLQSGSSTLNEVVVTGYTSQRRKDISGSVAIVDVGEAKKIPATSSEQLLQGQAAGVTVVTQGAPGSAGQVFIRGISSFGNVSPLYVIDGVQEGSMSNVNPNDIESISVLKDAGSTAIYGVGGGNGVVIVTTKKGKIGKTKFAYDAYYGSTQPKSGNVWNVLSGSEYLQLVQKVDPSNNLIKNGIKDYGYQSATVKGVGNADDPNTNPNNYLLDQNNPGNDYLIQKFNNGAGTDWFHAVFKAAPQQQHTFTASGATERNSYLFSLSYTDQQGTLIDTYFKRYQARINTTFSLNDHIRVGENIQAYYISNPNQITNQNEGNAISETYRMEPQIPIYDIRGNYGGTYDGPTQLGNAINPVAVQNRTVNDFGRSLTVEGSAFAEVDFLKHFTARTSINGVIGSYYYNSIAYQPYDSGEGHGNPNAAFEGAGYNNSIQWSNTLRYDQTFGKHNIKLLGGFESKSYEGRYINAQQTNFFSLDPAFVGIGNGQDAKTIIANSGPNQPNTTLSYFARLDYSYNDKYILSGTIRRDGSSVFYPGRQYGNFPSVTAAWRVSQEDFLKSVSWLNDLKLRGSYGEAGYNANVNAGNPYSQYRQAVNDSGYDLSGTSTSSQIGFFNSTLGNKKTTWETDKTLNFGLDATILNNRLDFTAEYYVRKSSNLLFNITLPATVGGASSPSVNTGEVQNKGVDLAATYHGNVGSAFKFNIGANIGSFKNRINSLVTPFFSNFQRNGAITYNQVGSSIGEFYGYKVLGYFSSAADVASSPTQADAAPGRFKYADTNHDGKIDANDRVAIGNPNPDFTYGVNLSASYKGFDFSMVLYGSHGNKDYNYIKYWTDFYSSLTGNKSRDLLYNSWSPSNLNPKTPIAESTTSFSTDQTVNSWYVENGSFLKCRVLQVGYNFAAGALKSVGVDRLHLYVQATNLFTITKYTGLDPELQAIPASASNSAQNSNGNGTGTDIGAYPNNERKFIVGVNLSF